MSDLTSKKIQFFNDLSFNIMGIPPSTDQIEQAKEQAASVIKHCQLFLKITLILSAIMLVLFAASAYFSGLTLGASAVVLFLFSFSAFLATHGAISSSILFLFFANLIAFLAFFNQHMSISIVVCVGFMCASVPYFRLGKLIQRSNLAKKKLDEYSAVDEDKMTILAAWSEAYPACRYYFEQVSRMQRSVTRAEYEAADELVFKLNKEFAYQYSKPFNYVPFFFG